MRLAWTIGSLISIAESTAGAIGRNPRGESRFRSPMGGNAPWGSRRRSRKHGGVGGWEGRPSLLPNSSMEYHFPNDINRSSSSVCYCRAKE
jgi:hypothetical protein